MTSNRYQTGRDRFENALVRSMSRRRLLAGTGALAALGVTASLPGRASVVLGQGTPDGTPVAAITFKGTPFTLGVASGDPLPDSVVLWTRLAPTRRVMAGCHQFPSKSAGNSPPMSDSVRSSRAGRRSPRPQRPCRRHWSRPGDRVRLSVQGRLRGQPSRADTDGSGQ